MCFTDFDGYDPSVFDETTPIAKNEHVCSECGETIVKGAKYKRVFGVWDGDAKSFKICDPCDALRERIRDHELAEGCDEDESLCPFGYLREYLANRDYPELKACFRDGRAKTSELREAFMKLPLPTHEEVARG